MLHHSILIIYDYFAPAYKAGGPTQSLVNMVRALSQQETKKLSGAGLHLKLICTDEDLDGTKLPVTSDRWIENTAAAKIWYASEGNRNIEKLIEPRDVLFINSIFSHHFNYPSLLRTKAKRKIISPRGMLDAGSLSQKSWKKKLYLAYWKLTGLHKLCEWHATTEQEKENIQKVFGTRSKVWVAPNFPRIMDYQKTQKQKDVLHLISVAVISPMKNHLLVLKALKLVKETITYHIYGPVKDKNYWLACEQIISLLPRNIQVKYYGDVIPDKLPDVLQTGQVAILPSKSENFGHAIFEAFTAGKPVITSHHTPWNLLEENNAGRNVAVNDEQEIATAISFFAKMDQEALEKWSVAAREFALAAIDKEAIEKAYFNMFEG